MSGGGGRSGALQQSGLLRQWVLAGIVCGLLATAVYPLLIIVPMPLPLTLAMAAAFGPLLSVASLGLYHFLTAHRRTVTLQLALIFNMIAGTLVSTMLIVQMSVREYMSLRLEEASDEGVRQAVIEAFSSGDSVQLGLDVAWDVYIALGTALFAVNMLRHPKFGRVVGTAGVVVGALVLVFNFATFPVPPAQAGSLDVGPLVGLWYLAVAILMIRGARELLRSSAL